MKHTRLKIVPSFSKETGHATLRILGLTASILAAIACAPRCGGSGGGDDTLALLALLVAAGGDQCSGKSWNHPAGLGDHVTESGEASAEPRISLNSSGYGALAYYRAGDEVRLREYQSGSWSGPVVMQTSVYVYGDEPQIAVNESGDAVLGFIWDPTTLGYANRVSGTWSSPAPFSPPFGDGCASIYDTSLALDGSGNAVWAYTDAEELFRSEYRGGTWTHPSVGADALNSGTLFDDEVVTAANPSGVFAIIWTEFVSNDQTFVSIRNGSWDDPDSSADNLSPDGQDAVEKDIAIDDAGNMIAVWSQSDGSHRRIYKAEYANGTWSVPSGLSDAISPSGTSAHDPVVGMSNDGKAIIAWIQLDQEGNQRVLLSVKANGSWAHPPSVNNAISASGSHAYSPEVAMNGLGEAIVIWSQSVGTKNRLHMVSNFSASFQGNELAVEMISPVGTHVGSYDVAIDNSCNATIVWDQSNGTDDQIFMSEFR